MWFVVVDSALVRVIFFLLLVLGIAVAAANVRTILLYLALTYQLSTFNCAVPLFEAGVMKVWITTEVIGVQCTRST